MSKREEIEPNKGEKRYIRRDEKGRFVSYMVSGQSMLSKGRHVTTSPTKGRSASTFSHGNYINHGPVAKDSETKPSLGERLMALRQKIVESGQPLLSWDEINEEAARRRGKIE